MSYILPGKNFNQRGTVQLPNEICRTIIGGGGQGGYHAGNEPKVIVAYEHHSTGSSITGVRKDPPEPRDF